MTEADRNRMAETRNGARGEAREPGPAQPEARNLLPLILRDNLVVKKTGARPTRNKRPDGVTEWRDADGIIFKRAFPSGRISWYDAKGQLHRDDGPAVEGPHGDTVWLQHGKEHREGGPAIEDATGKYWFRYGKKHRDDGPAIEHADGRTEWWRNNRRLKPEQIRAIMEKNGAKAAEPFLKGLDHEVTPFKQFKLKKP